MSATPTITKSTSERYDIRTGRHNEWAIIMVDERGGLLNIQSDYGNYGYHWSNHGCKTFKHFLIKIDTSYLINKIAPDQDFDAIATLKQFRDQAYQFIRTHRKELIYTRGQARALWEEVKSISEPHSPTEFVTEIQNSKLDELYPEPYHDPGLIHVPNRQATQFCERIWPIFVGALREEIGQPVD